MANKRCPACKLVNPATAERCDCGRSFIDGTLGLKLEDRLSAGRDAHAVGERPTGLTVLAVANFALGVLGVILLVPLFEMLAFAVEHHFVIAPNVMFYFILGFGLIALILILAAGIGYVLQKSWGRTLGNAYAVISVLNTFITIIATERVPVPDTVVGLAYPALTLFLVNVTFKNVLVH
jgi:hypothetical protein